MTQETPSRRTWLRRVTVTAAVIGGVSGSAVGVTAGDDARKRTTDGDDRTACADGGHGDGDADVDVRLTPACTDGDRDVAVFCVTNDGSRPATLEWRVADPPEERIEFVGCQTVRVVGSFVDVIIGATFVAADGEIGNLFEPFGAVDGVRTFDVRELEGVPDDAVVDGAEAFLDDPVVPGVGDLAASNPAFDACQEEFFGEVLVGDGSGDRDATAETDEAATVDERVPKPSAEELETLTVAPETTTCFPVDVPDGPVAVQLFRDGELLVERTSAADVACPARFANEDGEFDVPSLAALDEHT